MQTAFITGCATGFGARLARRLLQDGWRVIATDPDLDSLQTLASENCITFALDVRNSDQVLDVVTQVLATGPVDLLVNNGGYAIFGTQEDLDPDAMRDMFEVNVFGLARVTRALLPTLRAQAGMVVQLSSVAGRTVFPESGWYAASKYAVEALSEALFQETSSFGIRMRIVEPGSFATQFLSRAEASSPPRDPASPYAPARILWDARKVAVLEPPQDPDLVVDAILDSLSDPTPFRRVIVGPDAERILALRDLLGADAFSRFSAQRNGLASDSLDGDVMGPREVLGSWKALKHEPDALIDALEPTLLALHFSHLTHWSESEDGRAALELLMRITGGDG